MDSSLRVSYGKIYDDYVLSEIVNLYMSMIGNYSEHVNDSTRYI